MTGRLLLITLITASLSMPVLALDKMKLNDNLDENKALIHKDASAERKPSSTVDEAPASEDDTVYGPGKLFRNKEEWVNHRERFYGRDANDR